MTADPYPAWPYPVEFSVLNPPLVADTAARLVVVWRQGMLADFADLRFRTPENVALTYRVESYTASTVAVVWVELPLGCTPIVMLYGNAAATSESSADAFVDADDFAAAPLNARWTDLGGTAIAAGALTITGDGATACGIRSVATYAAGYAVAVGLTVAPATTSASVGFVAADGSAYCRARYLADGSAVAETLLGADGEYDGAVGLPAGSHVIEVRRPLDGEAVYALDGTALVTHETDTPPGTLALPVAITLDADDGGTVTVDWVAVRRCQEDEPVFVEVDPFAVTAGIGVAFAYADVAEDHLAPGNARFDQQLVASYSVSRDMANVSYMLSGEFDRHIDPAIRVFRRVDLVVDDYAGVPRRIFFGYIPSKDFTHGRADHRTGFVGTDYGRFISSRGSPRADTVMPAASNPGAWLKAYFDDPGQWFDMLDPSRQLFDTTKIRSVPGWGTTIEARDIACGDNVTVMQMAQTIADSLGWIFLAKWRDVGTTQTYNHQDPLHRILHYEARHFDEGGEGVGYHDTTPANIGGAGGRTGGVDIEYCANEQGYNVGWIRDGEWLRYTVDLPSDGVWSIRFRVASTGSSCYFDVYLDDAPPFAFAPVRVAVPNTGSYETFVWTAPVELYSSALTHGAHTIHLAFGGNGTESSPHQNLAGFDLIPPPVVGTPAPENVRPALYFCDELLIDDPDYGLDLPAPVAIGCPDETLVDLKYQDNAAEACTAVVVRYKWTETDGAVPPVLTPHDDVLEVAAWATDPVLEQYVDHVEVLSAPIVAATEAAAQAIAQGIADDLLAFFEVPGGTVTATLARRTDLQYLQLVQFTDRAPIPEVDGGGSPYYFRITNIKHTVALADVTTTITAMPATRFALQRRLNRALKPDQVSETEAVIDAALAVRPPVLTGHVETTSAGPAVVVHTDAGAMLTVRGAGTAGDRVLCIYSPGAGYVAVVAG